MMPELVQNLTHFQVNVPVNSNSTTNWVSPLVRPYITRGILFGVLHRQGFFSVVRGPCGIVSVCHGQDSCVMGLVQWGHKENAPSNSPGEK